MKLCCSQIISKLVEKLLIKYDLLFFLEHKDSSGKSKLLSLESAKTFCGSGPQKLKGKDYGGFENIFFVSLLASSDSYKSFIQNLVNKSLHEVLWMAWKVWNVHWNIFV